MWNEYTHKRDSTQWANSDQAAWVGERYLVWSTSCKYNISTWLYIKNEKIILEITPDYPWTFVDPKSGENYITYDEFIKNYKPYVIREISREIAQQWLDKTAELIHIIEVNDVLYLNKQ